MKKAVWTLCLVIVAGGCTQLKQVQNLDELLVLKDYADERDSQEKWVAQEEKRFQSLLAEVEQGTLARDAGRDAIAAKFGEPVVKESVPDSDRPVERWLYRHPIQKLANDRVYLYFDDQGHLLRYEHVTPPSKAQQSS